MESLHNEKWYNGINDYRISVIKENDGSLKATAFEVQQDREVSVLREITNGEVSISVLVEKIKSTLSMYPFKPI